jgi:hypothetical protein
LRLASLDPDNDLQNAQGRLAFRFWAAARPQGVHGRTARVYDILGGRIAKLASIISLLGSRRVVLAQRVLYLIAYFILHILTHRVFHRAMSAVTFRFLYLGHLKQQWRVFGNKTYAARSLTREA